MELELRSLRTQVLEWSAQDRAKGTVLLLHGFADCAGSFDLVSPALAAAGYRVVAPDLRGFGGTGWAPRGSYYHFPDYVADVDELARVLDLRDLLVVGHSMGGSVATLFAGSRPSLVRGVALLEGLGPPETDLAFTPQRLGKWLDDLTARRSYEQSPIEDPSGVLSRLVSQHPGVPREVLASRVPHLAHERADGRWEWRFDPLHRSTSPTPFLAAMYRAFLARIQAPTLVVGGGVDGYHPPDEADRIGALSLVTHVELAGAGHMMHWTQPGALSSALLEFFSGIGR